MDLNELRLEIDKIDDELVSLFGQRMDIAARIADYKKENGLPILVPSRERENDARKSVAVGAARYDLRRGA